MGRGRLQGCRRGLGQARDLSRAGPVGGRVGVGRGRRAGNVSPARRVVRPGALDAGAGHGAPRRRRSGHEGGLRSAGREGAGRDRARSLEADDVLRGSFRRVSRGTGNDAVRGRAGGRGDPLRLHPAARPALPPHDHLGPARADSHGAGGPRGRAAPGTPPRGRARGARPARPAQHDRRTVEGRQRRCRDPRIGEARRDRVARRAPGFLGPRHRSPRQRRQLRPRHRSGPRGRRGSPAETDDPLRSLHERGNGTPRIPGVRADAPRRARSPRGRAHPRHRRRQGRRLLHRRPARARRAAARHPRSGGCPGRRHDQRRSDSRDRQLRLPPRGRAQLRRQPGHQPLSRGLPRRVRHLRQGGPRGGPAQRRGGRGRRARAGQRPEPHRTETDAGTGRRAVEVERPRAADEGLRHLGVLGGGDRGRAKP